MADFLAALAPPVVVKTASSPSAIASAQCLRPAHEKDVRMLLRCCTVTLLLLVIGCAQCLSDTFHDCVKSWCEFHSEEDGESYITRVTLKISVQDGLKYVCGFTSHTVKAEGTMVSEVNGTFSLWFTPSILKRYLVHPITFWWVTKSPFVEDFWSRQNGRLGILHLSVYVYNMSVNQSYVSKLRTDELTELEITGNSWPSTSGLTLELPLLKKLSLADNGIEIIHKDLLLRCVRLEVLNLRRNKIKDFSYVYYSLLPLRGNLEELNVAENNIFTFMSYFSGLRWYIKKLNLSYNKISVFDLIAIPINCEVDLSFNNITLLKLSKFNVAVFDFEVDRMVLVRQNISSLSEVGRILANIDREMFEYSVTNVELVYHSIRVFGRLISIHTVNIPQSVCTVEGKYIHCVVNGSNISPTGNSSILNLAGNPVKIGRGSAFKVCPENLVDLSENDLTSLESVPLEISNAKELNLSRNKIRYISSHLLQNMTRLTVVDLSYNQLQHVQLILYSSLRMLDISKNYLNRLNISHSSSEYISKYLNISHNSFSNILQAEWLQFDNFLKVDLGENNFECCSPEGQYSRPMFLIYQRKILNLNSSKALTCVRPYYGRVEMTTAWLSEDHCQFYSQGWVAFGCLLLLLPLLIHGVDLVDYFMHQAERDLAERLTRLKKQGLEEDENCALDCEYDAFVCHSHKDAGWVTHELVPNLENDRDGHQLCIHYRNFQLGSFIEENVEEAMNTSRKVIVVVTRSFLQSDWCKMELTYAWEKMVREGRNYIIVIERDRIPKGKRPPILSYLMRSRTYLEWPEAPTDDVKQECWNRVRDALGKSLRDRQQEQADSGIAVFQMDC